MPIREDDPNAIFAEIIKDQVKVARQVDRTETKETPIYQKGSFSPALVGTTIAGTYTYGAGNLVEWTRIGNRLFYNGRISITVITTAATGNITVTGWPFSGVADTNMAIAGVGAMTWSKITFVANYLSISMQHANGTAASTMIKSGTAAVAVVSLTGAEIGAAPLDFRFGGDYRIA